MTTITKFSSGETATAEIFNRPLTECDDLFDEVDDRLGVMVEAIDTAEAIVAGYEERVSELEGVAHEPPVDDTYNAPVRRGYNEPAERWEVDFSYESDDFEYSNGAFRLKSPGGIMPGTMIDYGGVIVPSGWLQRDGSAISRSSYSALFAVLCPSIGNPTISIASPCVVSLAAHGMRPGDKIFLTSTGALPTGLAANTIYYLVTAGFGVNGFELSAARGGSAINTSGSQSGVHTLTRCPYGLGDGSTTYNLPNDMGRATVGAGAGSGLTERFCGETGGEETHALITAELAAHGHDASTFLSGGIGGTSGRVYAASGTASPYSASTSSTGSGTAHNTMPPFLGCMKLIKY